GRVDGRMALAGSTRRAVLVLLHRSRPQLDRSSWPRTEATRQLVRATPPPHLEVGVPEGLTTGAPSERRSASHASSLAASWRSAAMMTSGAYRSISTSIASRSAPTEDSQAS